MDIRDVKAFLPTMRETDDILTFVMTFERALELNGIDRGMGKVFARAIEPKVYADFYRIIA